MCAAAACPDDTAHTFDVSERKAPLHLCIVHVYLAAIVTGEYSIIYNVLIR
jgi:hypothetical protein